MRIFNRNIVLKIVTIAFISLTSELFSQENTDIEGTYTVYITSLKKAKVNFNEDQLFEIEELRKETEDYKTKVDGIEVLIMSREKMEGNLKWPKYSLIKE
ncbi:MAG: hypothetical protein WEA99_02995 [Brumimicrobium sp.]